MNHEKAMRRILFFITLTVSHICFSMNFSAFIKDKTGTVGIVTDTNTVKQLENLSHTFAQNQKALLPHGYEISTSLTKEQLIFLMQLIKNKDNVSDALYKSRIVLNNNLTRPDIDMLGLIEPFGSFFKNIFLLETKDNVYVPVSMADFVFFTTLSDMAKEFPTSFVIPIPLVDSQPLIKLVNLLTTIELPKEKLSYPEWDKYRSTIMTKILAQIPSPSLLPVLQVAHYLNINFYALAALFEIYKKQFSDTAWQNQENNFPFLRSILDIVDQEYPSIEFLLRNNDHTFYAIKEVKDPSGKTQSMLTISSQKIYRLNGLYLIPNINTYPVIEIKNTKIKMIEIGDFDGLTALKYLLLSFNKELSEFQENSFHLQNLQLLRIMGSNFNVVPSNVFNLPFLQKLELQFNHVQRITKNWAINLLRLRELILDEPMLNELENGWLNGLFALQTILINRAIPQALIAQIQNDLQSKTLVMLGNVPILRFTAGLVLKQ